VKEKGFKKIDDFDKNRVISFKISYAI